MSIDVKNVNKKSILPFWKQNGKNVGKQIGHRLHWLKKVAVGIWLYVIFRRLHFITERLSFLFFSLFFLILAFSRCKVIDGIVCLCVFVEAVHRYPIIVCVIVYSQKQCLFTLSHDALTLWCCVERVSFVGCYLLYKVVQLFEYQDLFCCLTVIMIYI